MDYFDDILNVYAYLKSKQQKSMIRMENTAKSYHELERKTSELDNHLSDALSRARRLANTLGVSTESGEYKPVKPLADEIPSIYDKIALPDDFNVDMEFAKLAAEARTAGFTNVKPEELLTPEEIAHALAYEAQLDEEFAKTTRLQKKDIAILVLAIVLQVLRFYISSFLEQKAAVSREINQNNPSIRSTIGSAGQLAGTASRISSSVNSIAGNKNSEGNFKNAASILKDPIPYLHGELPNELKGSKVLGNDRYLGWIFGVGNILTDSMTLHPINSFKVQRSDSMPHNVTFSKISTVKDVLMPIALYHGTEADQRSILAAMLRQGSVLSPTDWSGQDPDKWLNQTVQMTQQIEKIRRYSYRLKCVSSYLSQAGLAGFIDTIIIALHSSMYRPSVDGECNLYAMRTNKIIIYSGAIAAGCNSIPAIAAQDLSKMDLGGLLATILHFVGTMRFRINVKAEFLESKYLQEINKELEEVNAFFK